MDGRFFEFWRNRNEHLQEENSLALVSEQVDAAFDPASELHDVRKLRHLGNEVAAAAASSTCDAGIVNDAVALAQQCAEVADKIERQDRQWGESFLHCQ